MHSDVGIKIPLARGRLDNLSLSWKPTLFCILWAQHIFRAVAQCTWRTKGACIYTRRAALRLIYMPSSRESKCKVVGGAVTLSLLSSWYMFMYTYILLPASRHAKGISRLRRKYICDGQVRRWIYIYTFHSCAKVAQLNEIILEIVKNKN